MKNINELKEALSAGKKLVWNDPQPIDGNDYVISHIEDLNDSDDWDNDTPILIQYGGGSEAQVTVGEIVAVLTIAEYATLMKYDGSMKNPTLEEIQEYLDDETDLSVWDYPMAELAYVKTEVNENIVFVEVDGEVRVCEF